MMDRLAAAPISWGVCEVPGWGWQMDSGTVLAQMREVGVRATEFGPDGFLPADPQAKAAVLHDAGLQAVGGFVPVILHDPAHDPMPGVDAALDAMVAAGASTLVLAAATGREGYDGRAALDAAGWTLVLRTLDLIDARAALRGITATLHPHVGTLVERRDEVRRVLDGSGIGLCLDTGHLMVGGTDPADLARTDTARVKHVHLKDVDAELAARTRTRELQYTAAVGAGMYRPLGQGDVDVAGIIGTLEGAGYDGWYVMEQDTVLARREDGEAALADVRASVDYLRGLG
jgi:inosose dehydratase